MRLYVYVSALFVSVLWECVCVGGGGGGCWEGDMAERCRGELQLGQ